MIDRSPASQTGLTVTRPAVKAAGYPLPERRTKTSKVLVVSNDLLAAEVLVSALIQSGFLARFAVPVTTRHLQDIVAWKPDLALLDIDPIERRSSIELIGVLSQAGVTGVAMDRETDGDRMWDEPICAGASAMVNKNSPLTDLIGTFCLLLRRDFSNEPRHWRSVSRHPEVEPVSKTKRSDILAVLTVRERSVLAELMNGHRAVTIAATDNVSISTVRSQIKSILQKLGVNSQLAAVALARQVGWNGDRPDASVSSRFSDFTHDESGRALSITEGPRDRG